MGKVIGVAVFLTFAVGVWVGSPAVAVALNASFRPDYQMRDFASEYYARLRPNRVHWFDYRAYRLQCAGGVERRAILLHTHRFAETPDQFLARRFPDCPRRVQEERSAIPSIFSGIAVGRW